MSKLFLIDAYALIYRSYYAFIKNPRINSKGDNTSAVLGFCNTLHEVLTKEKPTHIAVAFDYGKTFRHERFPDYKAQREETPEDIKRSVPIIKEILEAMHVPVLQVDGFEADDVIGTLAVKFSSEGIATYMLTPDKDYCQLVRENVYMFRPRHGGGYETLDESAIEKKYGIESTTQVIDLLALMGDSADNFPGCPGVGEKTAVKLIAQFGSIENMLQNTEQIAGKLREKVENAKSDIELSKFLATIRTDVPIDVKLDEMKITEPDAEKLKKIFIELEFRTMYNKFVGRNLSNLAQQKDELNLFAEYTGNEPDEQKEKHYDTIKTTPHNYKLVDSEEEARALFDFLITKRSISLDTETTSLSAIDAELVGLSFACEEGEAFYVSIPPERNEAEKRVKIFKPIYENEEIEKIGQNIKYDYEVLRNYGITIRGEFFDTMIAHYVIQPELRHNMDYLAETLLGYKTIHIDELIGPKGKNQKNMRSLSPTEVCYYACEDADITLRLKNVLKDKLKKSGADELFRKIEMPLIPVLAEMEINGVCLDTEALNETSRIFNERMNGYEQNIYELAGESFNISSPRQVGNILFGKLQIVDKPKKTRTGQYVTNEEVLQSLKAKHPIVENILAYRGMKKLLSTYIDALPKLINKRTGRIHTSFNQAATSTGRLSSSEPNLQNIPVRTDDGKEIRKCFIPEKGCLFFSADYSQIELRIMAHLSEDPNMIDAFRNNIDIHKVTAAKIWHENIDDVTETQRKKAKQANFGIIYGITTFGLAQRMGISNLEARKIIDGYFNTYPKVREFIDKSIKDARKKGYVETLFNRKRYLPDINSHNATVRGFAERNAINAPIQGSEADIIKVAMINIQQRFERENIRSKMILQVHDELNFSVIPEEKNLVENIVLEEMQRAYELNVPLVADAGWGNNWLEAH